jgi:hypothetical protein
MNIISVNQEPGRFANGFGYFCADCGVFFSVQLDDDFIGRANHCPCCGGEGPLTTISELLAHCDINLADPVNFYGAFPLDEPIPESSTGATPRQVKIITSLVILDKQAKRPVATDTIAAEGDIPHDIVARVFEELHITETGGAA